MAMLLLLRAAFPTSQFVVLDEDISGCRLRRRLDGKREISYNIPPNVVLRAGRSVKIWASGQGGVQSPPDSLVLENENSWGAGANVVTAFINKEGEERATHTQKTIQTGQ
uniref:LTD domain-containing protein n=1 Tax=Globodera pallida TaxID=36090 RepID=A0A183BXX5_GLOPA